MLSMRKLKGYMNDQRFDPAHTCGVLREEARKATSSLLMGLLAFLEKVALAPLGSAALGTMLGLGGRCQGIRRRVRSGLHVSIFSSSSSRLGGCGGSCLGRRSCLSRRFGSGGSRSRRAFGVALRIDKDVVLSAVLVTVQSIVERWVVVTFEHVVPFILKPVQRLLRANGAVLWVTISVQDRVVTASPGQLRLADLLGGGLSVGDLALERVHEHLLSTRVGRVDPEPGAVADSLGARRHVSGDVEDVLREPGASMVGAENGKVLRLDVVHIGLVNNANAATRHVTEASSMDGRVRGAATAGFAGPISQVGAAVVTGKVGRPALVASDFDGGTASSWELEDIAIMRRVLDVVVEPPLLEGHVL